MTVATSSFVITAGGIHIPQPVMSAYFAIAGNLVPVMRAD
jgi:hypothetical protein